MARRGYGTGGSVNNDKYSQTRTGEGAAQHDWDQMMHSRPSSTSGRQANDNNVNGASNDAGNDAANKAHAIINKGNPLDSGTKPVQAGGNSGDNGNNSNIIKFSGRSQNDNNVASSSRTQPIDQNNSSSKVSDYNTSDSKMTAMQKAEIIRKRDAEQRNVVLHTPEADAQKDYDIKMREKLGGSGSSLSANFTGSGYTSPVSVKSGGNRPISLPGGIKIVSQNSSGFTSNPNVKIVSNNYKNLGGMRTSDETNYNGIKIRSQNGYLGMNYPSPGGRMSSPGGGGSLQPFGVYAGGKTGGVYRRGSATGVTSVTNYCGIFGNTVLAERCGVTYDPKMKKLHEISVIKGKKGKITKEKIVKTLLEEGYGAAEADKYAAVAMDSLEGKVANHDAFSHDALGESKKGLNKTTESNFVRRLGSSISAKDKEKVEIRKVGEKFVIYKPIGLTATDFCMRINKSGRKIERTVYGFTSGAVMQGSGEAGQGISSIETAYRVVRIAMPSISKYANNQFKKDMKYHCQNFVTFKSSGVKGFRHQWTVDEMKNHLTNTLGFSDYLVNKCRNADDFSEWAKAILKDDRKYEEMYSVSRLSKNQINFLQDLTKSRAMTPEERMRTLRQVLNSYGVKLEGDSGHFAVQRTRAEIKKAIKIYGGKDKVPADLMAALKEKLDMDKLNTFKNAGRSGKVFQIMMLAKRSLEQHGGEAGKGLAQATRMANITKMVAVGYVKVKWLENIVAREIAQKALYLIAKGNLLAAKASQKLGFQKAGDALNKTGKLLTKGSDKFKKFNRGTNGFVNNFKYNVSSWFKVHNPIAIAKDKAKQAIIGKIKGTKTYEFLANSKFGKAMSAVLKKVNIFKSGLAELWRKLLEFLCAIGNAIAITCIIVIVITLLSFLLGSVSLAIMSMFNLNSQEYDTKQYLTNDLKSYFEADMKEVTDLANDLQDSSYDASTNPHVDHVAGIYFDYEDYKDYEKYKEAIDYHESYDFLQSSNNGEIMSMALVRYDYNLGTLKDKWFSDDPKKSKQFKVVEEYMKQLYYGSHSLSVRVEYQTFSSSDTNDGTEVDPDDDYEYTVYTIYATYKTYYFDYLFSCPLMTEPQREISKQSPVGIPTGVAQSWDSIYYSLRQQGISHNGAAAIMSNMAHESADRSNWQAAPPDPTSGTPNGTGAYGICQWTSSGNRKAKLIAWCESQGFKHDSTSGQLAYMMHELHDEAAYNSSKNAVFSTTMSAYDIANTFGDNFEIYHTHGGGLGQCSNSKCEHDSRGNLATTIAAYYGEYEDDWEDLMNTGQQIAEIALSANGSIHYTQGAAEGNSYVGYRTTDLATAQGGKDERTCGTDCSGFVVACYKEAGVTKSLPYSTGNYSSYNSYKLSTAEAAPGDVAWRSGHAGIVTGNGKTMELHTCYYDTDGHCNRDCSPGNLTNFSCVYRLWE